MAKILTFAVWIAGTMILLNLAGLTTSTGFILNQLGFKIGEIQDFTITAFYLGLIAFITSLLVVTGIRAGFIGAPTTTTFAAAAFALVLAFLMSDLVSIIKLASTPEITWVSYIIFAIVAPLILAFSISIFDWARGNDT